MAIRSTLKSVLLAVPLSLPLMAFGGSLEERCEEVCDCEDAIADARQGIIDEASDGIIEEYVQENGTYDAGLKKGVTAGKTVTCIEVKRLSNRFYVQMVHRGACPKGLIVPALKKAG